MASTLFSSPACNVNDLCDQYDSELSKVVDVHAPLSRCLVSSRKWGNLHVAFPLLKINIPKNPDSFHYQEYLWKVIYSSFLVFKLLNNLISCLILAALIHSLL